MNLSMREALPRADVGILTFREDELEAVLERFPGEKYVSTQRVYNISRLPLDGGERYTIAVTRCVADFASGDAVLAFNEIVQDLAPNLLLIVGIAVGTPSEDYTLGDVVVATGIIDASKNEIRGSGALTPEPMHKDVVKWASNLPALVAPGWNDEKLTGPAPSIPQRFQGNISLKNVVLSSLKHQFAGGTASYYTVPRLKLRASRLVAGTVAASDHALSDSDLECIYEKAGSDLRAIESKSLDVYGAALLYGVPTMSIRGINEIVGMERDPKWTRYASRVAASFALAFLKARPIEPYERPALFTAATEASSEREISLTAAFSVKRLTLSSIRGFPLLDLPLKLPEKQEQGQWTVILGDNGIGKTTILRALTLALSPSDVVHAVLGRMGATSPTVRAGSAKAVIRLRAHDDEDDLTTLALEPSPGGEVLRRRTFTEAAMPFIVAYGSRRGSGLLDSGRSAEPTPLAAVETLFDEGASLMQPDSWLIRWQLAALQGGKGSREARFFDAILSTLCELLPDVKAVHVSAKGVEIEGPTLGRVPLGALSDGYRTTMGWILDMVARWVEEARRRNLQVDGDFHEKMAGVAVIDEIDLHLHPRWQRDVISMVRGHFPRMSFVVTTHNPLTLLGARPGEIYVLRRGARGGVEILQRDLPPGAGAERILTGEWFGLPSTLDDETLDMLAEHQRLIRDSGLDAPEAVKLEEELRRRLGSFADTPVERLAHEAMAEHVEKDLRELTPEERKQARAKVAQILDEKPGPVKPAPVKSKPKAKRPKQSAG
ncbi:AAA family ATPase [Sorangium cellulosum]|uniref:AAA family ATPase n=1 Tax=Sorangium cellulosum TaxID=56 RepID=UPI0011DD9B6D|nr:AAA family ATPase [Sorangium cellulosum]